MRAPTDETILDKSQFTLFRVYGPPKNEHLDSTEENGVSRE